MLFSAKNAGALNIFITSDLYRDAKKTFVWDLAEIGFYRVPFHLLQDFRYQLDEPYLNLNTYEFECDKIVVTSFKVDDFVIPKFDLKLELADRTVLDGVKSIFNSSNTILIKPDKIAAPRDLKEKSFGQREKI